MPASASGEDNTRAIEILQDALQTLQNDANAGRGVAGGQQGGGAKSMRTELRSLDFWRAIIAECIGSFFYVFLVCGAIGQHSNSLLLSTISVALATGCGAAALIFCFGSVSGAHVSPAVTIALAATRNISPIRGFMFVTAQCGGGIAGAALLYGVSANPGMLQLAAVPGPSSATEPWQMFTQEVVLTFLVVLCYFVARGQAKAPAVGAAYLATTLTSSPPSLNPARALGPSFVLHKWDSHWVFWFGPLLGGLMAGMLYEFILNPRKLSERKGSSYGDSSSVHSDPDNYEDMDKGCAYNSLRNRQPISPISPGLASTSNYCLNIKSAAEPIYSPRSLYTKSPALTRANLNRSQSVYTKSPPAPIMVRSGAVAPPPLTPSQSLYPGMVCRTSVYNMPRPAQTNVYQLRSQPPHTAEPIYGQRQQSASPAEESSYGSYKHSSKSSRDYPMSPNGNGCNY